MVTLDRTAKDHALLILPNGLQYDVYGEDWPELKSEAAALAESLGISIDVFNSDLPEV